MAERRQPLTRTRDELRRSFWLEASIAFLAGTALGLALPAVDGWLDLDVPLLNFGGGTASSVLQTIATVSLTVAGISFSVIMVAFTLASQQHGPRVLPTFQADRLSHAVLAMFLGTFIYALVVLGRIQSDADGAPELALAVAIALAAVSFGFFIAFIHHVVRMLQISEITRRIAADGRSALQTRFPDELGHDPKDPAGARERARARRSGAPTAVVRAERAGFLASIDPGCVEAAARRDGLIRQRVRVGDFVVSGAALAEVWCETDPNALSDEVERAFEIADERSVVQDPAFPIRQLADVALRGLSPSLNDPTTAENAMGSLTDLLVRFARRGQPVPVRVDDSGEPRFVAVVSTLDDLVRLGFEQVRVKAATYPVAAVELIRLLSEVERSANEGGIECAEARRQAALLSETVAGETPIEHDVDRVRDAQRRMVLDR
jgi:uncharacterized membrane protein